MKNLILFSLLMISSTSAFAGEASIRAYSGPALPEERWCNRHFRPEFKSCEMVSNLKVSWPGNDEVTEKVKACAGYGVGIAIAAGFASGGAGFMPAFQSAFLACISNEVAQIAISDIHIGLDTDKTCGHYPGHHH